MSAFVLLASRRFCRPVPLHGRAIFTASLSTNSRISEHRKKSAARFVVLLAGSVAAFSVWNYSQSPTSRNDAPQPPSDALSQPVETEDLVLWKGMVHPALDLAAADAKLRAEQTSSKFRVKRATNPTRSDSVRVPSNNPTEDERSYSVANVGEQEDWKFWGVYDGHAGWATAKVLRSCLSSYVVEALRKAKMASADPTAESIDNAIKTGFLKLDNEIISDGLRSLTDSKSHAEALSRIAPARAGSCALLAIFDPINATLRVACTGDSRAVLGRRTYSSNAPGQQSTLPYYTTEPLSIDQTGFNEAEIARISQEHPDEPEAIDRSSGRLLGLAVTRAFGDHRWKWPVDAITKCNSDFFGSSARPKYFSPPYLTAEPEIMTTKVNEGDFLILASDGLWDHMSSEDAVECVSMWVRNERSTTKSTPAERRFIESKPLLSNGSEMMKFDDSFKSTPEHFVVEDNNVATHLVRNALGGTRRELFCSVMTMQAPESRNVRDDITVQVILFGDVLGDRGHVA